MQLTVCECGDSMEALIPATLAQGNDLRLILSWQQHQLHMQLVLPCEELQPKLQEQQQQQHQQQGCSVK